VIFSMKTVLVLVVVGMVMVEALPDWKSQGLSDGLHSA
jgi:hypothetical protein